MIKVYVTGYSICDTEDHTNNIHVDIDDEGVILVEQDESGVCIDDNSGTALIDILQKLLKAKEVTI